MSKIKQFCIKFLLVLTPYILFYSIEAMINDQYLIKNWTFFEMYGWWAISTITSVVISFSLATSQWGNYE